MKEKKAEKAPFSDKDLQFWRNEIKMARQKREEVATQYGWDDNLERYIPKPHKKDGVVNADVNIGADFRDVERKKAALFYDMPEVSLSVAQDRELPVPEGVQLPAPLYLSTLVVWQQELLNALLGPQHANVKPTVLQAIFDCLCPSGLGPVTIGYQCTFNTVKQAVPVIDPETQLPVMKPVPALAQAAAFLGVTPAPMPEPLTEEIDVEIPIHERFFVSNVSPKAALIPHTWRSTQYQRAPWLGHDWKKPTSQVIREHSLPKTWKGAAEEDVKPHFEDKAQVEDDAAADPFVTGVEIYYRKQLRSDKEEHPEALMKLVLADGKDEPIEHRPCPYQDFDETGAMTEPSLKGFTVRPLALRQLTDSAWIPSDCSITRALTRELEKFREQSIRQRDTNHNVILFDTDAIDPTAKDKVVNGPGGKWVGVTKGALAQGKDAIMAQAAQMTLGRENFIAQDYIEKDREQILGIGANQVGVQTKGKKTATEQSIVQRNSEARFEQERQAVLAWFVNDVVMPFDTLVLRYADERIAVQILGEVRGKLWNQFKSYLAGGYKYELRVDSGKYLDIEADRRQWLQMYNQVRPDPMVNPRPILKKLGATWGIDPAEFVVEPQPPQKELKASIAIKGEHLDPALPQFALMVSLLRQGGWEISEDDVRMAQQQAQAHTGGMMPISGVGPSPQSKNNPQHPGGAPTAPTLNQHQMDESGEQPGPKVM